MLHYVQNEYPNILGWLLSLKAIMSAVMEYYCIKECWRPLSWKAIMAAVIEGNSVSRHGRLLCVCPICPSLYLAW